MLLHPLPLLHPSQPAQPQLPSARAFDLTAARPDPGRLRRHLLEELEGGFHGPEFEDQQYISPWPPVAVQCPGGCIVFLHWPIHWLWGAHKSIGSGLWHLAMRFFVDRLRADCGAVSGGCGRVGLAPSSSRQNDAPMFPCAVPKSQVLIACFWVQGRYSRCAACKARLVASSNRNSRAALFRIGYLTGKWVWAPNTEDRK